MSVKRMGKGLEALIRSDQDQEKNNSSLFKTETESISKIKLNHIHPNPNQPRKLFDAVVCKISFDYLLDHHQPK